LKHTQKHKKRKGGIEPRSKAHRLWRTVRPGEADCPHGPRGPSANVQRTVREGTADRPAWAADCPLNPTEPPEANPEKRTVRGEHADCPPGTHGPSARYCGLSETTSNQNSKPKWIETKGEQEHEEHPTNRQPADRPQPPRGPSAPHGQSRKMLDLEGQLPQIIIGFPKRLKLWRQGFGDLKSITQGCYSPKILPPNSPNHRESRIL
jgi:hypothetical protein